MWHIYIHTYIRRYVHTWHKHIAPSCLKVNVLEVRLPHSLRTMLLKVIKSGIPSHFSSTRVCFVLEVKY